MKKTDLGLLGVAVAGAAAFLVALPALWPLPGVPLDRPSRELADLSLQAAGRAGLDLSGWETARRLDLDVDALSWLETEYGRDQTASLVRQGAPVWTFRQVFKRRGRPSAAVFRFLPASGISGWSFPIEDDEPGARLDSARAWEVLRRSSVELLGLDPSGWEMRRHGARDLDRRRDHEFVLERNLSLDPAVRIRCAARVAGDRAVELEQTLVVPPEFARTARARRAGPDFLRATALGLFAVLGVVAFLLSLRALRRGGTGLRVPVVGAATVVACLAASRLLRDGRLFELWDPMGPRWMALVRVLVSGSVNDLLPALMVFFFLAAAEALDREAPRHRGIALRNFLTLRWGETDVGHASMRGFLLGFAQGGLLAGCTWLLSFLPGSRIDLQPRGFFLYGLDSSWPTLLIAAFFLQIALVEELGYRHFAGSLLLRLRAGRVLAALIPAVVYGLVHAGLDFLPPGEPWWARLVPITLVGFVWGLAFVRWDALTVLFSHWACDLFLFNRPRLDSDRPGEVAGALLCLSLPLLPAAVNLGMRAWRHRRGEVLDDWREDPDFAGRDPESSFDLPQDEEPSPDGSRRP